jgi:hypothetical protein
MAKQSACHPTAGNGFVPPLVANCEYFAGYALSMAASRFRKDGTRVLSNACDCLLSKQDLRGRRATAVLRIGDRAAATTQAFCHFQAFFSCRPMLEAVP